MNNYFVSEAGLDLIRAWESCKLHAYDDGGGVATIGWGHTRNVKLGDTCTQQQADDWLEEDANWAAAGVDQLVKVAVTQNQFDALVSFAMNCGVPALRNSTLLRKLNAGQYENAATEFSKWVFDNGKVLQGLINRRAAEKALFLVDLGGADA